MPKEDTAPTSATQELTQLYADAFANVANGQRAGQALFNALKRSRPDIAEEIRGTRNDPFAAHAATDPRFAGAVFYIERRVSEARPMVHGAARALVDLVDSHGMEVATEKLLAAGRELSEGGGS